MNGISLGVAFVAGLASFLSPCVLPIVPPYLGFITGYALDDLRTPPSSAVRARAVGRAVLFVLGFSVLFVGLGATATGLGLELRRWLPWLQRVGGALIVVMGLHLLGLLRVSGLARQLRSERLERSSRSLGAFGAGVAFGAGWTPCIGPVLATLLLLAGMQDTMLRGLLLLAAYSVGLGLPFVLAAALLQRFMSASAAIRAWTGTLERISGGVLVLVGLLLASGHFAALTRYLARFAPLLAAG